MTGLHERSRCLALQMTKSNTPLRHLHHGVAVLAICAVAGCQPQARTNIFVDPDRELQADTTVSSRASEPQFQRLNTVEVPRTSSRLQNKVSGTVDPGSRTRIDIPERLKPLVVSDGDITLNFKEASINKVVGNVLGDLLGANFVVDPRVNGTVTLETNEPISEDAALDLLEEILAMNGASLRLARNTYFIEPQSGEPVQVEGTIRVARLDHVSASNIVAAVGPFLTPELTVSALEAHDAVLVSGPPGSSTRIFDLIDALDIDVFADVTLALFPLNRANAEDVVPEIEFAFRDAGPELRLFAIERMNAILVASENSRLVERVRRWIANLDYAKDQPKRQVFVYDVSNRRAEDLAETLQAAFSDDDAPARQPRAEGAIAPAFTPVETTSGDSEGDEPPPPRSQRPNPAQRSSEGGLQTIGNARITADVGTNTLVIRALPDEYQAILSALRLLDRPPLQVQLETTIAEVTLNDDLRFGVNWFLRKGDLSISLSSTAAAAALPTFPGANLLIESKNFDVVLSALDSVSDVEVISSPTLTMRDNETARLQVGDEVPIVTQTLVSADNATTIANSVEFRNTGIILEVTPRINASGVVALDIKQEVSDVVETTTSGIDSPTVQQRSFESSVVVRDGEALALGGMIRRSTARSEDGLPLLSDVPVLGNAFKTTENSERRTELIVLIRPRVIYDYTDAREAAQELRSKLRGLRDRTPQSLFEADRAPPQPERTLSLERLIEGF